MHPTGRDHGEGLHAESVQRIPGRARARAQTKVADPVPDALFELRVAGQDAQKVSADMPSIRWVISALSTLSMAPGSSSRIRSRKRSKTLSIPSPVFAFSSAQLRSSIQKRDGCQVTPSRANFCRSYSTPVLVEGIRTPRRRPPVPGPVGREAAAAGLCP